MFEAIPRSKTPEVAGSYVTCWISGEVQDDAEDLARSFIEEQGWTVEKLEEVQLVEESDYLGTEDLKYFREAEAEGARFVFHNFPETDEAV